MQLVGRIWVYAGMTYAVDTNDQQAARMAGQAQGLAAQAQAATAYVDPELIAIGEAQVRAWMTSAQDLAFLEHYVENLFRRQAHVRSGEVEELLGLVSDPFESFADTASKLTDADFKFRPARSSQGEALEVAQGSFDTLLASPDREARRTAYESFTGLYLEHKNTLAASLLGSVKANVFRMRLRRHTSTLAAALFPENIPLQVFDNVIDVFRRNLPVWQRYWRLRRRALRVETLYPYDIWAPLSQGQVRIPYTQAVEWICAGLAPLGKDYVEAVRSGCLEQRWVDVYPNQGKMQGAFSGGWQGTYPFILMSYDDTPLSLGTLAHELGHSMHSYLTWQTQPFIYSDYSSFVAEVASNFHQAMLRAYLLETSTDRDLQLGVIDEAMANLHRYLFIMPTLARFERVVHEKVEAGQGLSADDLIELMADLFEEAYGGEMGVDRQRVGITWAAFPHLYMDYYVFQYATGISGANALANRILRGEPRAAEAYLGFLKSGSSDYPLEVLRRAGVDLGRPEPVQEVFNTLERLVERLEGLLEL
jgi:oligoendopeptidase F